MDSMLALGGAILLVVASVSILIGTPMILVNLLKMSQHRKGNSGTWHDLWGMNKNNLVFFPSLLDEQGLRHRKIVLRGFKIVMIGIACIVVFYATGVSEQF